MLHAMRPASVTLKRGPSVYSFSQLAGDGTDLEPSRCAGFGPLSTVADLSGHLLPTYAFGSAPPPKRRYLRIASCDSLAIVPDIDSDPTCSCPGSPASKLCYDAWDVSCCSSDSDSTLSARPTSNKLPLQPAGQLAEASQDSTLLETVLTALWDDCAAQQLFRYDLSACATKCIPGPRRFVAQLNEGRATNKRATEFKMDKVVQLFDGAKFNFNKAYVQEVLFQFEPSAAAQPPTTSARTLSSLDRGCESMFFESTLCGPNPNLVVINVSPIEYGHVLLVPRAAECLPQLVDPSTVELALHFAKETNSAAWRVGYNSLGAFATINHLHFQAYQLSAPFACELCPTVPIAGIKCQYASVTVSRIANYPVNGWVVGLAQGVAVGEGVAELAAVLGKACMRLAQLNVPHNLLITDSGRRVFVWPQCFAERQAAGLIPQPFLDLGVNPAAFEISGHILLKRQEDYDAADEQLVCALLGYASLPEERFLQLSTLCFA